MSREDMYPPIKTKSLHLNAEKKRYTGKWHVDACEPKKDRRQDNNGTTAQEQGTHKFSNK